MFEGVGCKYVASPIAGREEEKDGKSGEGVGELTEGP